MEQIWAVYGCLYSGKDAAGNCRYCRSIDAHCEFFSGKSGEKRVSVDEQPSFCDCVSCWNTGIYDFGIENCGTGTEHDCRAFGACNFWKSCLEFHGRYGRRTGTGAGYPCL